MGSKLRVVLVDVKYAMNTHYLPENQLQILSWRLYKDKGNDELSHAGERYTIGVL